MTVKKNNVCIIQYASASYRNLAPHAAALLKASAQSSEEINNFYNIDIKYKRSSVDDAVEKLDEYQILAFSVYIWNFSQSIEVAKKIKMTNNNHFILFGGPSVPVANEYAENFLKRYPFIDMLVCGEGEEVFKKILLALKNKTALSEIKGIIYKDEGKVIYTGKPEVIKDFSKIPSPYLDGTYDNLLRDNREDFSGFVVETNRGCPYKCTFCSWGIIQPNLTLFPLERVCAEMDWISNNKIGYVYIGDANFGISKRDVDIAGCLAKLKENTGYPKFVAMCWAKHSSVVFEIAEILTKAKIPIYITLSVQSFNRDCLKAIKRNNIGEELFNYRLKEAGRRNFNMSTDLIIGLPFETYDSFKRGVNKIFNGITSFYFNLVYFNLLPATESARKEYINKYKIQTKLCHFQLAKSAEKDNSIREAQEIVISTSTMSVDDWKNMATFGFLAKAIYNYRVVFFIFKYLKNEFNLDLADLLEYIIKKAKSQEASFPVIAKVINILDMSQQQILAGGSSLVKYDACSSLLYPDFAVFLALIENIQSFYSEMYKCVIAYSDRVDIEVLKEVFLYQFSILPKFKIENYAHATFNYNLHEYFMHDCAISEEENCLLFAENAPLFNDIDEFIQKVIYGNVVFNLLECRKVDRQDFSGLTDLPCHQDLLKKIFACEK